MFADGNSSELDIIVTDLMEKNGAPIEEVINIKIEQEVQSALLCEVTKKKKKDEEDKVMIGGEKRILTNRLEENTSEVNWPIMN